MPKGDARALTDAACRRIKPPKHGRLERFDAIVPGLALRVTWQGHKSWSALYRVAGMQVRYTIGPFPAIGVAAARVVAGEARTYAARGMDYRQVVKQRAAAAARTTEGTFASIAARYIEDYAKPNAPRSWRQYEYYIEREMTPRWGDRPMADITPADIIGMRDKIAKGGKVSSNRAMAVARALWQWAFSNYIISESPFARGIPDVAREAPRNRVLTMDEIRAIWRALDGMAWPWPPMVRLLFYTAARKSALAGMAWAELDFNAATWRIPAVRNKVKVRLRLPLSHSAVELLRALPRIGGSGLVFPSAAGQPFKAFGDMKRKLDMRSGVSGWTLHDVRRSTATLMGEELAIPTATIGLCLGHIPQGVTAMHYDHATRVEERRRAFDAWAEWLDAAVGVETRDNIIPMKRPGGSGPRTKRSRPGAA